jgi:hypothetical protein
MSKLISIGQILDQTWDHYRTHFKTLMHVTLWFFLATILIIAGSFLAPFGASPEILAEGVELSSSQMLGLVVMGVSGAIVAPVIGMWIFMTLIPLIRMQRNNKKINLHALGKESWKKFFSYLWIVILKTIATILPILLIVPGMILLFTGATQTNASYSSVGIFLTFIGILAALVLIIWIGTLLHFSEYRFLVDGTKGIKALKESKALAKGRFWNVLFRIILPKLVFAIAVVAVHFVLAISLALIATQFLASDPLTYVRVSGVLDQLISAGVAAVSTPLFVIADVLIYQSLRK